MLACLCNGKDSISLEGHIRKLSELKKTPPTHTNLKFITDVFIASDKFFHPFIVGSNTLIILTTIL